MSALRTTKITDFNGSGPVEFTKGVTIPSGQIISGTIVINTIGVVTATTFSGSGAGVTTFGVANEATNARVIALSIIN
jgi:hypothetical protein